LNKINVNSRYELSTLRGKTKQIPLHDKLEMLNLCIEETEKYELLTTNQYLKHMILVIDILDDLTEKKQKDKI